MASRRRSVGKRRSAAGRGGGSRKPGPAPQPAGKGARKGPGRFPEVEELVELMDRHGLLEVEFHTAPDGTRRVRLARAGAAGTVHGGSAPHAGTHGHRPHDGGHAGSPAGPRPAGAEATAAAAEPGEKLHAFASPMVGTFYRAPSPEAPPFVSVGDKVDEHRTVCIIEAMKVMNEITPDVAGEVVSIEVENGEAVEYGQTLFLIRPA